MKMLMHQLTKLLFANLSTFMSVSEKLLFIIALKISCKSSLLKSFFLFGLPGITTDL